MSAEIDHQALLKAYSQADYNLRVRNLKIGQIYGFIFVALFFALDWVFYPNWFIDLVIIRIISNSIYLLLFLFLYTKLNKYVKAIGILTTLTTSLAFSWMVMITEGAASPYYAGLNLVILFMSVLLPWTIGETIIVCSTTIAAYIIACVVHYYQTFSASFPMSIFLNNLFFLTTTSTICIIANYYQSQRRFTEFKLRYELDIKNKQLAALDELKSQFFANVSHELRTPLTLILAPLQDLTKRVDLAEEVKSLLNLMRQNGLRLLRLVNDLLDVIRLEKKQVVLHLESLELNAFLSGLVDSMQHLAHAQGIKIDKQLTGTLWLDGDVSSLEKIFINLLHNSIKFTPNKGWIRVVTQCSANQAEIIIQDSGVGIAPEELKHVFEPFRQADGSSTRQFQGVGLGLSLVKDLVELHGGAVTIRSQVGQGTEVKVKLPMTQQLAQVATVPLSHKTSLSADADSLTLIYQAAQRGIIASRPESLIQQDSYAAASRLQPFILVVDDEPDMRQYLVSSLQKDYEVLSTMSGKEALTLIGQHKPIVIILDVMMPELDGLELCRQLKARADTGDIKIIMLTARVDEEAKLEALGYGADDFLTKPFSSDELKLRVKNQCQTQLLQKTVEDKNRALEQALVQLKETETQLFQSEKLNALGTLAAGLLHEMNNPLNASLVMLSVLKEQLRQLEVASVLEDFSVVEQSLKRLHSLVSDMKLFAYPSPIEDQRELLLADIIQMALRLLAHEQYTVSLDINWQAKVIASPTHLVQILINLLLNAFRAVEEGKPSQPQIWIKTIVIQQDQQPWLQIRVGDNGVGIQPNLQKRIFEPFYTTREIGKGLGLGLSISYTMVKQHGSELKVESQPGQTTEFIFALPMVV